MAASPGGVEVGRISVRVVPDTSKFGASLKAKLDSIEKRLRELNIKVTADTDGFTAPLEKTRQEQERNPISIPVKAPTDAMAAGIRAEALKLSKSVQVDIPITTEGERLRQEIAAQVAVIEALTKISIPVDLEDAAKLRNKMALELDLLKFMAAQANPTVDIHTEVDTASLAKATAEIEAASVASTELGSGLSGIASAVVVLGPALIPVGAALAGLVGTLAAPLAVVGGGLTLFGFLGGLAVSQALKQLKAIQTLQTHLATLTKGTAAYATTQQQLKVAQAALPPGVRKFSDALNGLKSTFAHFSMDILLQPITDGLKLLTDVLPLLTPLLKATSSVLSSMLGDLDKSAKSQGFKDFITAFAHQIGPDLRAFATIAGNVFKGLFGLFSAFSGQLSGSVLKSLENLTAKFATWGQTLGQSKGFKSFVDYLKQVGPKVAATLGDIAGAFGNIILAAAPIGTVVLGAIDGLAQAIKKIPTEILTTAAAAVVGIVAGLKLLGPLKDAFKFLEANPEVAVIAALAIGFIALYQRSKPLRHVLGDLGDFFRTQLLPVIKNAAEKVFPALKSAFHDISTTIHENKPFLETIGKVFLTLGSAAVVTGILALVGAIRGIGKAVKVTVFAAHALADGFLLTFEFILRGAALFVGNLLNGFGTIIHGAALAFGWIPGLGGKLKGADAAFHSFTAGVVDNLNAAADAVSNFRHKLDDAVHPPKPIRITLDDLAAVKSLEALQAFRFKDKHINITTNLIERVVGPGGGIGQPSKNNANSIPSPVAPPISPNAAPRTAGGSRGGDTYNIQAQNYHDFLRQLDARRRAHGGGGVTLTPAGAR